VKFSRPARRRGLVVLAVTTVAATAVAMVPTAQATLQPGGGMSKADRALLAQAVVNGDATVTLLVAARAGTEAQVASGITGLGGTIGYREDEVGYLRAEVPTANAAQVASISGVDAVDVDEIIPLDDPRPDGQVPPTPQTPPGPATPNNNPYMPIGDTGASQFMAAHPTWDGRGVRVGIIDSGVDLANPALQTTSTGARKIVDWVTATHPVTDNDPTWVSMATTVSGPTFTVGGTTYTAPTTGTFRFGTINERDARLGGEIGRDLNRDGNPPGSSGLFGVLWDGGSKVWVDTDQDFSFADQAAMHEYKQSFDQGRFGVDNPATPVVEELPFVVQVQKDVNRVNIGIVSSQHGSHVAGIVAANKMFGGAMSGAAPGAELVAVRVCLFITGCTAHALIEGMIYAAKDAHVDVINMSIGGLPSLNDGNNARAMLYDRLIDKWNVQMFI
jgi:Subtilase family